MAANNTFISLGYPLDQLLNMQVRQRPSRAADCAADLEDKHEDKHDDGEQRTPAGEEGGLRLRAPHSHASYTGNIVIKGRPGTGKSTLTLQIAASCHEQGDYMALYLPLEQTIEHVRGKAQAFGWEQYLLDIQHLHHFDGAPSPSRLADVLRMVLESQSDCHMREEDADVRKESEAPDNPGERLRKACGALRRIIIEPHARTRITDSLEKNLDADLMFHQCLAQEVKIKISNLDEGVTASLSALRKSLESILAREMPGETLARCNIKVFQDALKTLRDSLAEKTRDFSDELLSRDSAHKAVTVNALVWQALSSLLTEISQVSGALPGLLALQAANGCRACLRRKVQPDGRRCDACGDSRQSLHHHLAAASSLHRITQELSRLVLAQAAGHGDALLRVIEKSLRKLEFSMDRGLLGERDLRQILDSLSVYDYTLAEHPSSNGVFGEDREELLRAVLEIIARIVDLLDRALEESLTVGSVAEAAYLRLVKRHRRIMEDAQAHLRALSCALSPILRCAALLREAYPVKDQPPTAVKSGACVLVPMLTPRSRGGQQANLFEDRFKQLELLLEAASELRRHPGALAGAKPYDIRVVCIDCLNVFADRPLTRSEIDRIFHLIERHDMIGVFTIEEDINDLSGTDSMVMTQHAEFCADMVIHLTRTTDQAYSMRRLEVTKSRNQKHARGMHPFQIRAWERGMVSQKLDRHTTPPTGIIVTPKLQLTRAMLKSDPDLTNPDIALLERRGVRGAPMWRRGFSIGVDGLENIIPRNLLASGALSIRGERGTMKSTLALIYLLEGLCRGEDVLSIRLNDTIRDLRHARPSRRLCAGPVRFDPDRVDFLHPADVTQQHYRMVRWRYMADNGRIGTFSEIAVRAGMVTPEEVLDAVMHVFHEKHVVRVTVDDVARIHTSYPFLQESSTAGRLFIPLLANTVLAQGAGLVLVGTTGDDLHQNNLVNNACEVTTATLDCNFCDVFGDRYVVVTGEELVSRDPRGEGRDIELVPGVLRIQESSEQRQAPLYVDTSLLQGLVGFTGSRIYRPGLHVNLYGEGPIQQDYNQGIAELMAYAFASPDVGQDALPPQPGVTRLRDDLLDVHLKNFSSRTSEFLHESLAVLGGKPLSRTVVVALDEFWDTGNPNSGQPPLDKHQLIVLRSHKEMSRLRAEVRLQALTPRGADTKQEDKKHDWIDPTLHHDHESGDRDERIIQWPDEDKDIMAWPYYCNVLLVAMKGDVATKNTVAMRGNYAAVNSWQALANVINTTGKRFEFDALANETLICAFLDVLVKDPHIRGSLQRDPDVLHKPLQDEVKIDKTIKVIPDLTAMFELMQDCVQYRQQGRAYGAAGKKYGLCGDARPRRYGADDPFTPMMTDDPRYVFAELDPTADVFLCWYTQLRTLVRQYPQLGEELKVYALPGGGFRGDWYLGIVNGSVSINLGRQVIKLLTTREEEYKRVVKGVGLPTRKLFYEHAAEDDCGFTAWPGARDPLSTVYEIYRHANMRSDITDYIRIRDIFGRACRKLVYERADHLPLAEQIESVLQHVSHRIQQLLL